MLLCYLGSSVRKPKSSNIIFQRRNFVKLVRKQYGNPNSHVFLKIFIPLGSNFKVSPNFTFGWKCMWPTLSLNKASKNSLSFFSFEHELIFRYRVLTALCSCGHLKSFSYVNYLINDF